MPGQVYDVITDLDPKQLTEIAAETYRIWLSFSLGKEAIGGKTLAHPSGRYAASLSWKKTGHASVAIIADENIAPEALWLEEGRAAADMKAAMLGKGNTKISADGYRYRVVPIRSDSESPDMPASSSVSKRLKKMWAKPRAFVDADHYATMSDKPGASEWKIPAMAPYAPAASLANLLRSKYGI